MKNLFCAAMLLTLLGSTVAVAQPGYSNSQSNSGPYRNDNDRGNRNDQERERDQRQDNGGRSNPDALNRPGNDRPHWSRGDRLPQQYRDNQYAVGDWQQHHLRTPPRGYHWVRNDNDQYVLAAITSGIIAEIVGQNLYRDDYRWTRGERLSGGYLENRYVVSDWRGSRLHAPGRGQHWVRANNQFLLTAIATGAIAEVVLNDR